MLTCSFKSLHLSGPLGSLFILPSLAVGKSHTHIRSCSSFIGQLFIFVSDIISITACLLPCLQFEVAFDALLARAPALEQISRTHESQKGRPRVRDSSHGYRASATFDARPLAFRGTAFLTLTPALSTVYSGGNWTPPPCGFMANC